MNKKGIIIVNAFTIPGSQEYSISRLIEEFKLLDVEIKVIKNDSILAYISSSGQPKVKEMKADFILYLDKDCFIAELLKRSGYHLFNSPETIRICDDKMLTNVALSSYNIRMPKSIPFPLKYGEGNKDIFIQNLKKELGFPLLIKENKGSLGKEVYLINSKRELEKKEKELGDKLHFYQEFISSSFGKDLRVLVIGNRVVAAMKRVSSSNEEFRANIELGGKGSVYKLSKEENNIALKIAKILNADYLGIDFLFDSNGKLLFCEANSNAFFKGLEEVTKINVAKEYATYIYQTIYQQE